MRMAAAAAARIKPGGSDACGTRMTRAGGRGSMRSRGRGREMRAICVENEERTLRQTVSMCRELPQLTEVTGFSEILTIE